MKTIINIGSLVLVFDFEKHSVLMQSDTIGKYATMTMDAFQTCFDSMLKDHGTNIQEKEG